MINYYDLYSNELLELEKTCTQTIDLRNVFDNYDETIYYDAGHMSNFGNKIVASKIYEEISLLIEKDL